MDDPGLDELLALLGGPVLGIIAQVALGGGYVVRRNVRLMAEFARDFEQDFTRWTAGIVTAF